MSGVNESIVREFFEERGFLVRQQRKFVAPGLAADDEIDLVVVNPRPSPVPSERPFILEATDVASIASAVVAIKGWHTETFSAAMLAQEPELARFTDPDRVARCAKTHGMAEPVTRLLVVPALPQTHVARAEAAEALRVRGVDAVLPFRTLLADLLLRIEVNRNYAKSDLLQTLRILKNYDLIKDPAMELFRPRRRR